MCPWSLACSEAAQLVGMYKSISLDDVCECVCIRVLVLGLNRVTQLTYFPPLPHCFLVIM